MVGTLEAARGHVQGYAWREAQAIGAQKTCPRLASTRLRVSKADWQRSEKKISATRPGRKSDDTHKSTQIKLLMTTFKTIAQVKDAVKNIDWVAVATKKSTTFGPRSAATIKRMTGEGNKLFMPPPPAACVDWKLEKNEQAWENFEALHTLVCGRADNLDACQAFNIYVMYVSHLLG
jgi:hypothetical protein